MQAAVAEHIRSVGENDSPLPWLSTGASVHTRAPEGPCSNSQCSSPWYTMLHFTIHTRYYAILRPASSWKFTFISLFIIFLHPLLPARAVLSAFFRCMSRGRAACKHLSLFRISASLHAYNQCGSVNLQLRIIYVMQSTNCDIAPTRGEFQLDMAGKHVLECRQRYEHGHSRTLVQDVRQVYRRA